MSFDSTQQVSHTKFMHDLHLTGAWKEKIASKGLGEAGKKLSQCICCHWVPESQYHLLHCPQNPARTLAILNFSSTTAKKPAECWGTTVLCDAIEQCWMLDPTKNPAPSNWCSPKLQQFQFPSDKSTDVQQAFDDQKAIGWNNALHRYLAKSWAKLAAINRFNREIMNI